MFVKFKQSAHLAGKDYLKGTHDVPEKVLKDRFFQKMVQAGLIEEAEAAKVVSAESVQERQKKFAEKMAKRLPKSKAPANGLPQETFPAEAASDGGKSPELEPSSEEKSEEAGPVSDGGDESAQPPAEEAKGKPASKKSKPKEK